MIDDSAMSSLPALVVWGAVISKAIVVGIPAAAAALVYRVRRRRDLARALTDVDRLGLGIDAPREGPIAVLGSYHCTPGTEAWLDCDGERVTLDGDVSIVRGTVARWKRGVRTYALRDGDAVIALGRMSRAANVADGADYREAAGGWRLAPSAEAAAIQLCAGHPVACPKPFWPIRGALVLGLVGAVAYFGLGWLGNKLVAYREYPVTPSDDVSTLRAEIASALPRSREAALRRLASDLEYRLQTDEVIAQRIELARSTSDCHYAVWLAQELERYDDAVDLSRDCDPALAQAPLLSLGRYDEAASITDPRASFRVEAAIDAGRWHDAAVAVTGDRDSTRCLVRYLESRAGGAIGDLSGPSRTCRVIAGVVAPRDERAQYFSAPDLDHVEEVEIARWAFVGDRGDYSLRDNGFELWLAPFAIAQDADSTRVRRALLAVDLGRTDAPTISDPTVARWLTQLVALRSGKPAPVDTSAEITNELDDAAAISGGAPVSESTQHLVELHPCHAATIRALAEAAGGDGLALARVLESCDAAPRLDPLYVFAVAPKVTTHRTELASAIRNWRIGDSVHAFAIKRDLARLLGDDAGATRFHAIVERHAKVLGDRERVTALLLVHVYFHDDSK